MQATVKKWGNSAAVRIPAAVMQAMHLNLDEVVDVRGEAGRIVIEPVRQKAYDLDIANFESALRFHNQVAWELSFSTAATCPIDLYRLSRRPLIGNQCVRIVDEENGIVTARVGSVHLDVVVKFLGDQSPLIFIADKLPINNKAAYGRREIFDDEPVSRFVSRTPHVVKLISDRCQYQA